MIPTFLKVRVIFKLAEVREMGASRAAARMRPANPKGHAARSPGDVRAHAQDFQRHNLDWDLPAAWAALAFGGRRASCASTDALTELPVLAVVRHLTPLPRFTW